MTLQFGPEVPGQLGGLQHGVVPAEAPGRPLHGQELERGVRVEGHREHSAEWREGAIQSWNQFETKCFVFARPQHFGFYPRDP